MRLGSKREAFTFAVAVGAAAALYGIAPAQAGGDNDFGYTENDSGYTEEILAKETITREIVMRRLVGPTADEIGEYDHPTTIVVKKPLHTHDLHKDRFHRKVGVVRKAQVSRLHYEVVPAVRYEPLPHKEVVIVVKHFSPPIHAFPYDVHPRTVFATKRKVHGGYYRGF